MRISHIFRCKDFFQIYGFPTLSDIRTIFRYTELRCKMLEKFSLCKLSTVHFTQIVIPEEIVIELKPSRGRGVTCLLPTKLIVRSKPYGVELNDWRSFISWFLCYMNMNIQAQKVLHKNKYLFLVLSIGLQQTRASFDANCKVKKKIFILALSWKLTYN